MVKLFTAVKLTCAIPVHFAQIGGAITEYQNVREQITKMALCAIHAGTPLPQEIVDMIKVLVLKDEQSHQRQLWRTFRIVQSGVVGELFITLAGKRTNIGV
jgi:hypothetical protein